MSKAAAPGRLDPLIDWLAALFPAACAAYAGWMLGPLAGYAPLAGASMGAGGLFLAGLAFMMRLRAEREGFMVPMLADLDLGRSGDELVLDTVWTDVAEELDELLLDRPVHAVDFAALGELILDDALPLTPRGSRVVQLFEPQQLKERVDRHLANARLHGRSSFAGSSMVDSDPLTLALADLKRSLRRG